MSEPTAREYALVADDLFNDQGETKAAAQAALVAIALHLTESAIAPKPAAAPADYLTAWYPGIAAMLGGDAEAEPAETRQPTGLARLEGLPPEVSVEPYSWDVTADGVTVGSFHQSGSFYRVDGPEGVAYSTASACVGAILAARADR